MCVMIGIRRRPSAGGAVPLLAQPARRTFKGASRVMVRHSADSRLCGLWRTPYSWPHARARVLCPARRNFFELADVAGAARKKSRGDHAGLIYMIALGAVQRIDALLDVERSINGKDSTSTSPRAPATTLTRPSITCCGVGMSPPTSLPTGESV